MKAILCCTLAASALAAPSGQDLIVVGKPCLFTDYFAEWRAFPAILRDADGNLTCGRNRLNNGGATQGPPAAGTPAATATRRTERFGPQGHFTYRDPAGNLQDLWFDRFREKDRWHVDQLNNGGRTPAPPAAGDPSGVACREGFRVAYRDPAGAVQLISFDRIWQSRQLNLGAATDAPAAAGDPVQMVHAGSQHVLYRDGAGRIQDLRWDGAWKARPLNRGGATGAPGAAGEPAAASVAGAGEGWRVAASGTAHVAYRDLEGGIQHLWFDGAWRAERLNAGGETGAPPALGDPSLRVVAGDVLHVTYRDPDGNIQDLWSDGAWHSQRLNAGGQTGAPAAASDPVSLVPPSNWEFVAYVDVAGNAQLLSHFLDNPWQATRLNGAALK
jgi:hypothetical protein